jgi:PAS domain S-box-containing protein
MITGYLSVITFLLLVLVYVLISRVRRIQRENSPTDRTLQAALESIGDPVLLIEADSRVLWSNMAAIRTFGKVTGLKCSEVFQCQEDQRLEFSVSDAFIEGKILSIEKKFRIMSGEERLFLITTAPVRDDKGAITVLVKSFRDISQIEQLAEAAARSELKYMQLFENLMDGFAYHKVVTDENNIPVDYIFLDVNSAYERLTGLSREELVGRKVTEVLPGLLESEFDWIGTFGRVALTREPIRVEEYVETLQRWYAVNCYSPNPGTFAVIFEEITERKGNEQMVRASLEEKEILMREIHHRVNNNLRSISNILNVQASYIPEEWDWTSKILKDTQIRVMAMGLIHEALYEIEDLRRIPLGIYTRTLIGRLKEQLRTTDSPIVIHVEIPEDLTLNVEAATPCGLIITEMVSNSLKHAFRHGQAGHIIVSCMQGENGGYVLECKDDGAGIPRHVDFLHPETMGLKLLNSYVEMIDGRMKVDGEKGTAVAISFMENEETGSVIY